jgi:hypothetical protein
MDDKSIQFIEPWEMVKYLDMIMKSNAVKLYGVKKVLYDIGKVMAAEYSAIKGLVGDKVKFIFIYRTELQFRNDRYVKTAVSEQIVGPHYFLGFREMIEDLLKKSGYSRVCGITARNIDAMARLSGSKKEVTVSLGKEL